MLNISQKLFRNPLAP